MCFVCVRVCHALTLPKITHMWQPNELFEVDRVMVANVDNRFLRFIDASVVLAAS